MKKTNKTEKKQNLFTRDIDFEKILYKKYIPYFIFFTLMIFLHVAGYTHFGDDYIVKGILKDTVWDELRQIFSICDGWSSRYLINPPIHVMMHFDYKVWLVFEILMCMLLFDGIRKLCFDTTTVSALYIMMSLLFVFPLEIAVSVGWVVTSMTYIWTSVSAVYGCMTIKKCFKGEKINWYMYLVYILLTLFAANKEELSVMLTIVLGTAVVLAVKNKKQCLILIIQFVAALVSIFVHLFSSNNQARYEELSVKRALNYTAFDKLIIGVSATLRRVIFEHDFVFICAILVCAIAVWKKCGSKLPKVLSVVLILGWLIAGRVEAASDIVVIVFGCIAVLGLLVCLYYLYGVSDKFVMLAAVIVGAFAGRVTVGFGASAWSGYERTYTFLYYALIAVSTVVLCDTWKELKCKEKKAVAVGLAIIGILGIGQDVIMLEIV